jgi:hypothetical protein
MKSVNWGKKNEWNIANREPKGKKSAGLLAH